MKIFHYLKYATLFSVVFVLTGQTHAHAAEYGFSWAAAVHASNYSEITDTTVDTQGNSYTVGFFAGTVDFDPGAGNTTVTAAGDEDSFVLKFDPSGNFVWVKVISSTLRERARNIGIDSNNNLYIGGLFNGAVDFDPGAGVYNLSSAGQNDSFVLKLDTAGAFIWARSFGGTSFDYVDKLVVDNTNAILATGYFSGTSDFDPGAGVYNLTSAGAGDVFILKLDNAGNFVWAKSFGNTTDNYSRDIAVDSALNVYIVGNYGGTIDFDPGAGTTQLTAETNDGYILKLDPAGNFVWVKTVQGNSSINSLTFDAQNDLYLVGNFAGTRDFDLSAAVVSASSNGGSVDGFVAHYTSAGAFIWVKTIGGAGYDALYGIALDSVNSLVLAGSYEQTVDFDPGAGMYNKTATAYADVFSLILNPNGNFVWVKTIEGQGYDFPTSIMLDAGNNIFISGYFDDTADFDPDPAEQFIMTDLNGAGFVMKLSMLPLPVLGSTTASVITATTVQLNSSLISSVPNSTAGGFIYGTNSTSLDSTIAGNGSWSSGEYSMYLKDLLCGTTYYAQSFATNSSGTGYGPVMNFRTADCEATQNPTPATLTVYRLYSPNLTSHFYTTSAVEKQSALEQGYKDEGTLGNISAVNAGNQLPLYRLYSPRQTDHFYTTSAVEKDLATTKFGYQDEGVIGYIPQDPTVKVYRLYSPGLQNHFYTINGAEAQQAVKNFGYNLEGEDILIK